jgi:hypothetical protein
MHMGIPVPLDLLIEVVNHREVLEELALHAIVREYPQLVLDETPDDPRAVFEAQAGMTLQTPDAEVDGGVAVIDRAVKVVNIHGTRSSLAVYHSSRYALRKKEAPSPISACPPNKYLIGTNLKDV